MIDTLKRLFRLGWRAHAEIAEMANGADASRALHKLLQMLLAMSITRLTTRLPLTRVKIPCQSRRLRMSVILPCLCTKKQYSAETRVFRRDSMWGEGNGKECGVWGKLG